MRGNAVACRSKSASFVAFAASTTRSAIQRASLSRFAFIKAATIASTRFNPYSRAAG
jgi:hypothetical protein